MVNTSAAVDPNGLALLAVWVNDTIYFSSVASGANEIVAQGNVTSGLSQDEITLVAFGPNSFAMFVVNKAETGSSLAFYTTDAAATWTRVDLGSRFVPGEALYTGSYFVIFSGFYITDGYTIEGCEAAALPFTNFSTLYPYTDDASLVTPGTVIFVESLGDECFDDVAVAVVEPDNYSMFFARRNGDIMETTCLQRPLPPVKVPHADTNPFDNSSVDFAIGLAVGITALAIGVAFIVVRHRMAVRQEQLAARRDSSVSDEMVAAS